MEKRQLRIQEGQFLKSCLITFSYCRKVDLDAAILLVFLLLKKVLSASSYGHFTAAKEFWSQCHIFRFGNDRRSSRRGLLGRQNCILSWKSVPQGPFGQIKLYFKPEKRPAGAFWADKSNPRPMPQSPGRLQGGGPN